VDPSVQARLVEALGNQAVTATSSRVRPASAAEVALVCRICSDTGTPLSVSSGGEGKAPDGGIAIVLDRLDAVEVHAGGLTASAGAGATLDAVSSAVNGAGLATAAPMPTTGPAHVGSAVAAGGFARRALCGIEAILPTGEVVRAGGLVLKDVAGYDLAAVLSGSRGLLGLITSVSFRLLPAPVSEGGDGAPLAAAGELSDAIRLAFDPAGLLRS
jgi:glycolate oxidase